MTTERRFILEGLELAPNGQPVMETVPERIDRDELASMARPLRVELAQARLAVVDLVIAYQTGETPSERGRARAQLSRARARRDALKRLLVAVQTILDVLEETPDAWGAAMTADLEAGIERLEQLGACEPWQDGVNDAACDCGDTVTRSGNVWLHPNGLILCAALLAHEEVAK